MRASRRQGFTLIELIIVILVIGILAAIAVPKLRITRDRAYRNTLIADLRNVVSLEEIYHVEHFSYSTSEAAIGFAPSRGVTLAFSGASPQGFGVAASHAGVTDGTCAVFVGNHAAVAPATVPGVITCDFER